MFQRFTAAVILVSIFCSVALAQGKKKEVPDRAYATDFTVQLFLETSGDLSQNIFTLEEFGVWNFSAQWKGNAGGKFSGFLVKVKFESKVQGKDIYAHGRQAQVLFRERKTKKLLRTWNLSDIYIGDNGIGYRAQFFDGLNCETMEVTLVSYETKITRELPFACGE